MMEEAGSLDTRFWLLREVASLRAMVGQFDQARELLFEAEAGYRELGLKTDVVRASGTVRRTGGAARGQREHGGGGSASRHGQAARYGAEETYLAFDAVLLAEALYRLDRQDEADRAGRAREELGSLEDSMIQAMWRSVRAKVMARQGDLAAAESLAREAVEISRRTDMLVLRGNALMDLAEVLAIARDVNGAATYLQEALEEYEQKGSVVLADQARAAWERLGLPRHA